MVLRYAVRINGLDTVALTKLDVLDQCAAIKICTAYRYQGGILTDFPEDETVVAEAEPVYEEIEGWLATTSGAKNEGDLPAKARRYLERLAELIGVPFSPIFAPPPRDAIVLRETFALFRSVPSGRSTVPDH